MITKQKVFEKVEIGRKSEKAVQFADYCYRDSPGRNLYFLQKWQAPLGSALRFLEAATVIDLCRYTATVIDLCRYTATGIDLHFSFS